MKGYLKIKSNETDPFLFTPKNMLTNYQIKESFFLAQEKTFLS